MPRIFFLACCLVVGAMRASAIDIVFDYRYDTTGFFTDNPTAKVDLEAAATLYEMKLGDTLSAIAPSGGNTWTADFYNPADPAQVTSLSNLTIAQNSILVFVAGANLGASNELGKAAPGGATINGNQAWLNTVSARGQSGALNSPQTDFGPWGGELSFQSSANWYFDSNPSTNESFAGQNDFYSVAIHELGHLLGIGTAPSWKAKTSNGDFTGSASSALYGGAVPEDMGGGHFASGTMSQIYDTNTAQEVAMDPELTTGTRKVLTKLDVAALQDIGWMIVPEPAPAWLILGVIGFFALHRRRQLSRLA